MPSSDEGDSPRITLTPAASREMQKLRLRLGERPEATDVRIRVHPDAPLQQKYELEFVPHSSVSPDDVVLTCGDIVFALDERSAGLLAGTTIDFVESMWSSGFRFVPEDRTKLMSDPLAGRVQEVLREKVTPMVAEHGGSVTLVDVRLSRAFVKFAGGCQGCGLAPVTLKQGVAAVLKALVPEIIEVVDVTDHAAGESPYFPSEAL